MEYNKIIEIIKKTEPVLDNSEEMTDRIMQKIEQMPVGSRKISIMHISGIISGIAASLLICLFAYETWRFSVLPDVNHSENEFFSTNFLSKIETKEFSELNIFEKGKIIETIIKNKKTQSLKKEQLITSLSANFEKNIVKSLK